MTAPDAPTPLVIDAEPIAAEGEGLAVLAEVMPRPLQHLPAVRETCACGKNDTREAHGYNPTTGHRALSCDEVKDIACRVQADIHRERGRSAFRRLLGRVGA